MAFRIPKVFVNCYGSVVCLETCLGEAYDIRCPESHKYPKEHGPPSWACL